jgi:hypothetical protein
LDLHELEEGAFDPLRRLHRRLDETICGAYGWPAEVIEDTRSRNARLYDLNKDIVDGRLPDHEPF